MKTAKFLLSIVGIVSTFVSPEIVFAGTTPPNGTVPEPTALLVWAGLAGIGGLFFWRRQRDSD